MGSKERTSHVLDMHKIAYTLLSLLDGAISYSKATKGGMGRREWTAYVSEVHKVAYTLHNLLSGGGIQPCGYLIHE